MSGLALLDSLEESGALTATSLRIIGTDITADQYEALGGLLGRMHETMRWAIGDYILAGEYMFGQDAYQLQEALGISAESRGQYVRVAQAIPYEARRSELTWSHHRAVYKRNPDERDHWLRLAVENAWTKSEMEAHMRGLPEPDTGPQVVMEEVYQAARQVWLGAVVNDGVYLVDAVLMTNLGLALGATNDE